jgi:hypothetical protein
MKDSGAGGTPAEPVALQQEQHQSSLAICQQDTSQDQDVVIESDFTDSDTSSDRNNMWTRQDRNAGSGDYRASHNSSTVVDAKPVNSGTTSGRVNLSSVKTVDSSRGDSPRGSCKVVLTGFDWQPHPKALKGALEDRFGLVLSLRDHHILPKYLKYLPNYLKYLLAKIS